MPIAPYAMIPETPDGRNRIFAAPPSNKDRELRSSCSASGWHPPFPFWLAVRRVPCRTVPCCGKYDNPEARGRRKLDRLQYTT